MKKIIILLALLGIVFLFIAYFYPNPTAILKRGVISEISKSIKNIKYYKDRCAMHGPFVFAFEAGKEDIEQIIQKNALKKMDIMPDFVEQLTRHIDTHNIPWWKTTDELKKMEIYGKIEDGSSAPRVKIIFADTDNNVFYLEV
jgi:hypothetical protein